MTGGLLETRARRWRGEHLRAAWAEGAARLACGGALALAAGVWLDQAARLSQGTRLVWLALCAAAGVAAAWRWLARPWLSRDLGPVLDRAAAVRPALAAYLRPAWELRAGASAGTSESLRLEHAAATERRLADAGEFRAFVWTPGPRLRAAAAAALAAAVSLGWAPDGACGRLLTPWRDVPLERFVRVSPGDAGADWGRSVTVTARWLAGAPAGRGRHPLTLWVKDGSGWRKAAWDRVSGGEHRYTAEGVTAPLRYRLTWRDLESRTYAVAPVLPPLFETVRARVHGGDGAWTALTPAEPLTVMRGAVVAVAGRPNQALARAALRVSTLPQPVPLKPGPSGDYEASFVVQDDAALTFELETADGRADAAPPVYRVRAAPDLPPVVELLSPLETVVASPGDTVPIAFGAKDDGGLASVSLLVRAPGRPEREILLQKPGGKREFIGDHVLELAGLPLGRFEFQLKAVDAAAPPQAGLSGKGSIEIADLPGQHARAEEQWRRAESSLKTAAETAERLRAELAAGRRPSEAQAAALPRDWAKAAADMRQLAAALAQDAYANPGLAEETKAAAEGLSAAQQREVPQAQQAAASGSGEDAAARHERLARRADQARKMLSEGRALQSLQDFHSQAGRLSEAGASMEAGVEQAARAGKASPEAAAKLDETLSKVRRQLEELQKALEALPKADETEAAQNAVPMPLQSARDSADALSQALARGDFEEAARQARKLSEELSKIQDAVGQSASSSKAAAVPPDVQRRLDALEKQWNAVVDEQTRLLERTQKLEEAKVARRVESQKSLLGELARRQSVAVSSAASQPGFPADALASMRAAQAEFDRRRVDAAPGLLRSAALRARAVGMPGVADEEESIARALDAAAPASSEPAGPEAEEAAREQASVKQKTARLQSDLEGLEGTTGLSAGEAPGQLSAAQVEQAAAAERLSRRDSAGALPRQQKALELLSQGGGQMGQSAGGRQRSRQTMLQPFRRRGAVRVVRGGGSGSGAQLGFVPLPSAKDYLPPRELRDELEKSLHEARPQSQDALIKEYFKRIAQ